MLIPIESGCDAGTPNLLCPISWWRVYCATNLPALCNSLGGLRFALEPLFTFRSLQAPVSVQLCTLYASTAIEFPGNVEPLFCDVLGI